MRRSHHELALALTLGHGLISRRVYRHLAGSIDRQVKTDHLTALFPGIYAISALSNDFDIRARAAMLWDPDAVLTGRAAAKIGFWPEAEVRTITLAVPRPRRGAEGYSPVCQRIPNEDIDFLGRLRFTSPARTALDLAADFGSGEPIDRVLRTRTATLAQLHAAFDRCPRRRGNRLRSQLLDDSRDEPWSEAERLLHRMLRKARITGWRANYPVQLNFRRYFLDVAFPQLKIAIEVDGLEFHTKSAAFEADRVRQNALVIDGWIVLRFTWSMITTEPDRIIDEITESIRMRRRNR